MTSRGEEREDGTDDGRAQRGPAPLSGLLVVECGLAYAGPVAARYLAALGAEVVKLESRRGKIAVVPRWAPEGLGLVAHDLGVSRGEGPEFNADKRSVAVGLKDPRGRAILEDLVRQADVFLTNFSVPAMASLRIGADDLTALNPRLVYVNMSGFGTGPGPYRDFRSYGPILSAAAGHDVMTGDADRPPIVAQTASLDYVASYHAVTAILAALLERTATGAGAAIELSQFELATGLFAPELLHHQLSGVVPHRTGNRREDAAPRAVLPARGHDRWVAVEVRDDDDWRALTAIADVPDALRDARFEAAAGRHAHEDEVERLLGAWTATRTDRDVAALLQEAGVPAWPVQSAWDHLTDPQLEARGYWHVVRHDRLGTDLASRIPIRFGSSATREERSAPAFGRDTDAVLEERLGLSAAERDALARDGVVEREAELPADVDPASLARPSKPWAWPLLRLRDDLGERPEPDPAPAGAPELAPAELSGVRVLDLSDELSAYGTKLLALLGADVVRVEPPEGAALRRRPPLHDGESLLHRYLDAGKRSVVLDLDAPDGREAFRELAAASDLVYDSAPVGWLAERGCGWEAIRAIAPRTSLVSVTPFGQTGPYARRPATELGLWALSGALPDSGHADRAPVALPAVCANVVGTMGAIAALAALYARARGGAGQRVEVSGHETLCATMGPMLEQVEGLAARPRSGSFGFGMAPWGHYAAADRLVALIAYTPDQWQALAEWIHERTGEEAALEERYARSAHARFAAREEVDALIAPLTALYAAADFAAEAQERGIPAMALNSLADVLRDPHLRASGYWNAGEPGGPRWPRHPLDPDDRRGSLPAPELGAHTDEVLASVDRRTSA